MDFATTTIYVQLDATTTAQVAPLIVDYPVLDLAAGFFLFLYCFTLIVWLFKR